MARGRKIHIFASALGVVQYAARTLERLAAEKPSGRISVALSGGSTPQLLYRHLASEAKRSIPWSRLEIFFSDERNVPPDHPDSNYGLAERELFSRVPIPESQIHRLPGGAADLEAAVRAHEAQLLDSVECGAHGDPAFDLIWLGLGEDGHTASLFPGTAALAAQGRWVTTNFVPALNAVRLTFTYPLLAAAHRVQFLVLGSRKAEIVRRILNPEEGQSEEAYPASRVQVRDGLQEWVLDREAAAGLEDPGLLA